MAVALVLLLCLAVSSCRGVPLTDVEPEGRGGRVRVCTESACLDASQSILSTMDQTADPCQDFYQYACGGWLDWAEIPAWSEEVTKSFTEARNGNTEIIRTILEGTDPVYESLQKARNHYVACMNTQAIEDAGAEPLLQVIASLGDWGLLKSPAEERRAFLHCDQLATLAAVHTTTATPLFSMSIDTDDRNSSRNLIKFTQAGLGLGSRELYLGDHGELLQAYEDFGVTLALLLAEDSGLDTAEEGRLDTVRQGMAEILAFESQLAEITIPMSDLRDALSTYNPMSLQEFGHLIPEIDVAGYTKRVLGQELSPDEEVLVPTEDYFPALNDLLESTPSGVVHDYMVWQVVYSLAADLPQRYRDAVHAFSRVYTGISAVRPRWMHCAAAADGALGFVTGAEYVNARDSFSIKSEVEAAIGKVRREFIANLRGLDWMDRRTRRQAVRKARAVHDRVVAPDWIADSDALDGFYAELFVSPKSHFINKLSTFSFYHKRNLAKYGEPVDKSEWQMGPTQVNAYYSHSANEMVFLAGILRPPFYDSVLPSSLNYGSLGWIIGHELTHGFDDVGRNFDDQGNLNDWWGDQSAQTYSDRTQCMRDQYGDYQVGDKHVNGQLTLGENVADNGGLRLAYGAYLRARRPNRESLLPDLQALSQEQLFFLGAAQVWCQKKTPESALMGLLGDPHSPGKYRVIGTMSNMEEFSQAFQCAPGTAMNPVNKCRVW